MSNRRLSVLFILPLLALLSFLSFACGDAPEDAGAMAGASKALPRATPESQGVSSAQVLAFFEELDRLNQEAFEDDPRGETGFHSMMILRNGNVIAEGWWDPYEAGRNHRLYSLSKSFTSTAVGFAIQEGHFNLDDPVISFFPDDLPAEVSDNMAAMTVRDLIIMSTGQETETRNSDDWVKEFLATPVEHEPGSVFRYNTSATFMLSAIVQKTTGEKVIDYLTPRFFEPLGIEGATWLESPGGINTGGYGLNIDTEDIAKLGQFYLQKGMWKGEQLLPVAWAEQATSLQIPSHAPGNPDSAENQSSDWAQGYGFQFWRTRHNAFRGDGAFGQYSLVLPDLNVVIAATAGSTDMQRMLNLIWDHLYPAFEEDTLPPDAAAHSALREKLAALTLLPQNRPEAPALAAEVSGETYALAENDLEVDSFSLSFDGNSCTFSFVTGEQTDTIVCGLSDWMPGLAAGTFLSGSWLSDDAPTEIPVAASGRWIDDQTFEMSLRFVEAPDTFVYTASFENGGVTIKRIGYGTFAGGAEIELASTAGV